MTKKILVVDDEPNIVVPLVFLMRQNGYEVRAVGTGEDALDCLSEFGPDLILLDIMLPGMDGFEVCQALREIPKGKRARIVFLSAMGRDVDIAKGMALDVDAYITKPFSNADVVEKVKDLLEASS